MKNKISKLIISTVVGGLGMWIIAGLWHNLILPYFNENVQAHEKGIFLMLIGYLILAFIMTYIYSITGFTGKNIIVGLRIGVVVGILWVLPHGLVMAGAHETSVIYEIKNTIWHMFEQGVGGIIIALIYGKSKLMK